MIAAMPLVDGPQALRRRRGGARHLAQGARQVPDRGDPAAAPGLKLRDPDAELHERDRRGERGRNGLLNHGHDLLFDLEIVNDGRVVLRGELRNRFDIALRERVRQCDAHPIHRARRALLNRL